MSSGTLLGLDNLNGSLEVTGAFANVPNTNARKVAQQEGEAGDSGALIEDKTEEDILLEEATALQAQAAANSDPATAAELTAKANECISKAASAAASAAAAASGNDENYPLEMLKMLREVNVDNNCIGWYQSTYLGSFCHSNLVENQIQWQVDSGNSVVVLYDPVQSSVEKGVVIKAFRLSQDVVDMKVGLTNEDGSPATPPTKFVGSQGIFVEIPVKIVNGSLVRALLFEMDQRNDPKQIIPRSVGEGSTEGNSTLSELGSGLAVSQDIDFSRLDLSTNPFLEKNLSFLSSWVDELCSEQQKFSSFARGLLREEYCGGLPGFPNDGEKDKKKAQQKKVFIDKEAAWNTDATSPNRLDALLSNLQMRAYVDSVNGFSKRGVEKLFLVEGVMKGVSSSN